jgi:hypothetical protein
MYFPYFRGRQYELLALKDLAESKLINGAVVPIVEPIKFIPALNNSLTAFNTSGLSIGLVLNPTVGDLADNYEIIEQLIDRSADSSYVIPTVLMSKSAGDVIRMMSEKSLTEDNSLAILDDRDFLSDYQILFAKKFPKYTLSPDERSIRRAINQNKVLLEDRFHKQDRNADYVKDEFFSDDHIYYKDDDYCGFGDYSIVGKEYTESGFAPYAVAIHIVYFAPDKSLRIRHFISDSNDDISDVAGKFHEAVTKLNEWYTNGHKHQITKGLQILINHYANGTYPGLPTLKKLSIMHHLELMNKYLNGRLDP